MKKTVKTAMTAAMFATSLSAAAFTATAAADGHQNPDPVAEVERLETATAGTEVCVYGPPEVMESLFGTTLPEELALEGTSPIPSTTTITTTEVCMEGTAPIMLEGDVAIYPETTTTTDDWEMVTPGIAPLVMAGDLDGNFSLDARDISRLKNWLLQRMDESEKPLTYDEIVAADFNSDGKIDKEDLILLIRSLTGKPEDEEEPAVTTTMATAPEITTTTEVFPETNIPDPVYGPPSWFE